MDMFQTLPLERHVLDAATDIEGVQVATTEQFGAHSIGSICTSKRDRKAQLRYVELPHGGIACLVYGKKLRVEATAPQLRYYLIEIPLSGTSATYCGDKCIRSCPGQVVVVQPYREFASEWSADCSKLVIRLEIEPFEHYLRALLGRRGIRALEFEMGVNNSDDNVATLLRTVQWIVDEIDLPSSLISTSPLAGLQYERILMWKLLYCQRNNFSEELAALQLPRIPHYILKAERYIQHNYAEPIDLAQLVEYVGVSERTLLEGFKRYRDISPMRLLKLTRLDHVHLALKKADPAKSSVTDIALAHGFMQLGKFSSDYKERFGALPSKTLKDA